MRLLLLFFFFIFSKNVFAACIVSLNPALTETLFRLGLQKEICGTTSFSNFPKEAALLPQVGSYVRPNIEKIISLHPTHVLAFQEGDSTIKKSLERAKLNIITFQEPSLEQFSDFILKLGKIFQQEGAAKELVQEWTSQLKLLENFKLNKKILIEVDHDPIFIAGNKTFLSDIFKKCGLQNVYGHIEGYRRVPKESLLNQKPDVVLTIEQSEPSLKRKNFWKTLPSTKSALIVYGKADLLSRLGPRLPQAALQICEQIKNSSGL